MQFARSKAVGSSRFFWLMRPRTSASDSMLRAVSRLDMSIGLQKGPPIGVQKGPR